MCTCHYLLFHGSCLSVYLQDFCWDLGPLSICCFGTFIMLSVYICLGDFISSFLIVICPHRCSVWCLCLSLAIQHSAWLPWWDGKRGEKGVHSSLLQGSLVEGNDLSLLSGSEECNLCRRAVAGLCPPQAPASLILAALQDESSGWKSRDGLPVHSPQWCYVGCQPLSFQWLLPYFVAFKPVWPVIPRNLVKVIWYGKWFILLLLI